MGPKKNGKRRASAVSPPDATEPSEDLECGVCKTVFKDPHLLQCMHTFCESCILQIFTHAGKAKMICPVCRMETQVGLDGKPVLMKNHVIQHKVKRQKLTATRDKNLLNCDECEAVGAKMFCSDCRWKLCDDCTSYHKKSSRWKDHNTEDITAVPVDQLCQPEPTFCGEHNQVMKYRCEKCKVKTCGDCSHSKKHQGHFFRLLTEVVQEEVESLKAAVEETNEVLKKYDDHLAKVEEFQRKSMAEKETSQKVVRDAFNKMVRDLGKQRDNLLQWLDEKSDASDKAIRVAKNNSARLKRYTAQVSQVIQLSDEEVGDFLVNGAPKWKEEVKKMGTALPTDNSDNANQLQQQQRQQYYGMQNQQLQVNAESKENEFMIELGSRQITLNRTQRESNDKIIAQLNCAFARTEKMFYRNCLCGKYGVYEAPNKIRQYYCKHCGGCF